MKTIKSELRASQKKNNNLKEATKTALVAARKFIKNKGGKKRIQSPRIIPIPKIGGLLPLLPIFAGLSALGTIAGGVATIAKAVNKVKSARESLSETRRHNHAIESIARTKHGEGLYLKPYRNGLGLFIQSKPKN